MAPGGLSNGQYVYYLHTDFHQQTHTCTHIFEAVGVRESLFRCHMHTAKLGC